MFFPPFGRDRVRGLQRSDPAARQLGTGGGNAPPRRREPGPWLGSVSFHHYDLYARALAKIERAHVTDTQDVKEMFARGLIEAAELRRLFLVIEPRLYRYPAIDPKSFRRAVEESLASAGEERRQ
jgi:hypothetical protein